MRPSGGDRVVEWSKYGGKWQCGGGWWDELVVENVAESGGEW
jgi:hypothetical protein